MEKLIEQFLEHLRYERNVSAHTLRNYASDLLQFVDFLAPADASGKSVNFQKFPRSITLRSASGWPNFTARKRRSHRSHANSPRYARFSSFSCAKDSSN